MVETIYNVMGGNGDLYGGLAMKGGDYEVDTKGPIAAFKTQLDDFDVNLYHVEVRDHSDRVMNEFIKDLTRVCAGEYPAFD